MLVISEPFFTGAYFRSDFAPIVRKKFAARCFGFKARLKRKKFIFKKYSLTSTWEINQPILLLSRKSSVV